MGTQQVKAITISRQRTMQTTVSITIAEIA